MVRLDEIENEIGPNGARHISNALRKNFSLLSLGIECECFSLSLSFLLLLRLYLFFVWGSWSHSVL